MANANLILLAENLERRKKTSSSMVDLCEDSFSLVYFFTLFLILWYFNQLMQKASAFAFKLDITGLPNTSFFMDITIDGNDVVDDLVKDKAFVNANATETTEVVGDAGNFMKDAKVKKTTTMPS
jgi:hypothetical protein